MSHTVVLPALGESVTEGTVTRWLVEVGDTIEVDAPLVEVSTDKVDTEVPSPVAGVVEQILVPEDEDVEVGAALAIIGDGSGAAAPAAPAAAASEVETSAAETGTATTNSDKTWVIATDTVFKPFEYTDDSGNFVGIDVDIVAAVAEDQGFKSSAHT